MVQATVRLLIPFIRANSLFIFTIHLIESFKVLYYTDSAISSCHIYLLNQRNTRDDGHFIRPNYYYTRLSEVLVFEGGLKGKPWTTNYSHAENSYQCRTHMIQFPNLYLFFICSISFQTRFKNILYGKFCSLNSIIHFLNYHLILYFNVFFITTGKIRLSEAASTLSFVLTALFQYIDLMRYGKLK